MNLETIDRPTKTGADLGWPADVEVSAYFRALYRRMLSHAATHAPLRAVGVTSCGRGEGVSTVAARLAIAAAEDCDHKVLLADANYSEPSVHRTFAIDHTPGFFNVAKGSHSLGDALQPSCLSNLWVLPCGMAVADSRALEQPASPGKLLAGWSQEFPFVVVDLPHAAQLGGAVNLATELDGIVLVVDAECTRRTQIRSAANALAPFRLLGAVLNKRK